jgi:signal transduction histidine kinase/CheY-like chemotaxis protein
MADNRTLQVRVLVVAPTGRDAGLINSTLGSSGFACHECRSIADLSAEIARGAGMALVAEEALLGVSLESLVAALRGQPRWSDFPLLLMTTPGFESATSGSRLLALFGDEVNASFLERPLRVATLISSVRMALRARRRQYEVRDHLEEKERNEQKLLETQKLESLGVLAGGIAHDFNNLLTGILGNASLALELLPPDQPEAGPMLEQVVAASQRAAHLTQQLLAYAGKGRVFVQPVNLSTAVGEISQLVRSSIPKNVEVRLELAESLPAIEADAAQVQQIIMNLVINGAEAIPEARRGTVTVSTAIEELDDAALRRAFTAGDIEPGRYVTLEVRDTGAGMDEPTLERIFDPFFTTKFTGRGLGLAAVLGIVRSHKGALRVDSIPGQGSRFKIWFRAGPAPRPTPPPSASPPAERAAREVTVLVIDDEEVVCQTAQAALSRHGCRVLIARDGPSGIETFRRRAQDIDIVLLDLTMPTMNGEEVLERLQEIRPGEKVILSSGYSEVEVVRRFAGKGLADFVQKPYTAPALIRKVLDVARR